MLDVISSTEYDEIMNISLLKPCQQVLFQCGEFPILGVITHSKL